MKRPLILAATLLGALVVTACKPEPKLVPAVKLTPAAAPNDIASGKPGVPPIRVEILASGEGPVCKNRDKASIHYTGTLESGKQFDSSSGGSPFSFVVGIGQVIGGWDLVAAKMRQGDHWKVTIPWQLGYGAGGYPPDIPPRANLVFEMEMMAIEAR